ncbi:MAG: hydrogenase maturation nickel metallochaperone HypA/HybF [Planctomycetota bacterium]|jgi:Zn finger protein HypA/HybF involved in hydrogenase expression
MGILQSLFLFLRAFIMGRAAAAVENLALRQQVAVFKQSVKRPKLRPRDRVFWVVLSRLWRNWRSALAIVQPETVIKWHRKGFRLYWKWKSRRGKRGRPPIEPKIRNLIRRMSRENPIWGAPRIVSELALLGHEVVKATKDLADEPGDVTSVRLRVGARSGVVPDALRFAWDAACRNTRLDGSVLEIDEVAARIWCDACGREQTVPGAFSLRCPICSSLSRQS